MKLTKEGAIIADLKQTILKLNEDISALHRERMAHNERMEQLRTALKGLAPFVESNLLITIRTAVLAVNEQSPRSMRECIGKIRYIAGR